LRIVSFYLKTLGTDWEVAFVAVTKLRALMRFENQLFQQQNDIAFLIDSLIFQSDSLRSQLSKNALNGINIAI